jgi:hypothetical protein
VPNKFMAGGKSDNPHKNLQCHGCVVRLVISQRTAGKRNPMHTSDHPKKLELSALMSEGTTRLNSFCVNC